MAIERGDDGERLRGLNLALEVLGDQTEELHRLAAQVHEEGRRHGAPTGCGIAKARADEGARQRRAAKER
jgi:hypothetical protein